MERVKLTDEEIQKQLGIKRTNNSGVKSLAPIRNYKSSRSEKSPLAQPAGSAPKYGVGMQLPTANNKLPSTYAKKSQPQRLPYAGKVSASLPQYKAVTQSGGSKVPALPYYQAPGISSDTWKKQAEQLKEDVAQQQKTVRPWQNTSGTMQTASYMKPPQAFQKDGRAMSIEKPESVVRNEQKLADLKSSLANAQNQGYLTDYSEQWRAIESRDDAEDVKAKLARMASMKNNIGTDMGQNIASMNEYQRLRGELESKGINAEGVADWLRRNSNVMEAYYQQQRDAARAEEHPIIESLKTVPQSLYGGTGALAGVTQSAMNSRTGEYRPIDTMGDAFDIARSRQTVRGTVGEKAAQAVYEATGNQNLANAAKFLYGTAMSGLDSAFIAALGGGATAAIGATGGTAAINGAASIILGSNAASETMMDVVNRGGSTDQAVAAGILSGAAETIFEKVSIDGLISKFKSGEKGFRAFIKNATLQGASEASEEMATEIANVIADYYVNGGLSEIEQMRQSGMSDVEIANEIAKRVGIAGAGGFLMGFVGGGVASIGGTVRSKLESRNDIPRISAKDFANTQSPIWHNVDYNDKKTQAKITGELSQKMREEGRVVTLTEDDLSSLDQYFPDLRSLKKKERMPIMKKSIAELKDYLRGVLSSFKDSSIDFTVNGNILETRLYNTGINEVLEKVSQDKAAMLEKSKEIFANAEYIYSTGDKNNDPNIYRWNYFYVPLDVNGEKVGVRIAVRDMAKQNESQLYNWGIKKGTNTAIDGDGEPASPSATSVVPTNNIAGEQQNVNTDQPQQLPYAPGYNASNSPVQPTLPMASEVNARQQEDFESFWFGHPELSEQDAMRLYEEQQRKSQAEKPVSPVSSDSGKMPQRERRQAWNYADKVKKEFDLDIDDKSLRGDIENLFADVRKNGWTAENETRLQEMSRQMVEKSNGVLNEAESRPARDAKRFIRNTKLYITPSIKAEIEHNHGNYNAFRKKHMGKLDMKLVDSNSHPGQNIDAYYTELSAIAPEWFPAKDADMNEKDMLEQIIWFVDEDTDVYDHPFEADPEGAAEFIAGRIKEGYTDLFTKPDVDIEKAKQAFAKESQTQKALDATETKAGLSEDEKEIVSAMLRGQINPDSVTDQRLRSVYEARVANYAAQRDSRAARRNLRSRYKELAQDFAEYSGGWQDKVSGWAYDIETAERNIRDIIPDKQLADRFIEQYITPVHTNEADATRLKNELRGRLEKLDLGTKPVYRITPDGGKPGLYSESAIVQMYGEGLVNEHQVKMSGADVDRVKNAVSEFRQVYDQLLDMANESLLANGYAAVEKRANYFPHWQEPEPTGVRKAFAKMGMKILGDDLPTEIAGLTDTRRPGKKRVSNFLHRQGNQTEYDALKGFDIYIDSVADVIFHTDDIQRLRALETEIRYQASDKGVQRRVRDIMEDPYLDEDAKSEAVRKILEEDRTSLSHFVNWLRKYTDTLAGKKNFSDRDWEYKVGRDLYETMKAVEGRISANMVGGNISSAMTNLIPIFQGTGEVKAKYMAQAMKDVARSVIRDDGFAERSDFLTNRLGSDKLMKTGLEKATSVASKPFELVDRFASETLTRAKYMQNVDSGMDVDAAMADADAWAASLMADRSKGAVPLVFTEKNPVTKAFTMFQLEVNNQFRYMMKDLPRNMQDQGKAAIVGALMKIFIATGLYGELFKGLAGYDPTFNPLSLLRELIEGLSDEEKKKSEVITDFAVDAAKEIPFVGNVLGGGRLPVSNVGDGIKETANAFLKYGTGEQSGKAFLNTLGNSAGSTAAMLLLPMGGNQLKKTAQGLTAVARGKVTTTDNEGNEKIKYLVDQTPGNAVRGALFGQWSFPEAREYVDGGFKMTNAKASDVINRAESEAGIPSKTAMSVYKSMAGLGTKAYKLEKIFSNNDLTSDQMAWLERELLNDGKPGMADQAIEAGISPKQFYYVVKRANKDDKGGTSQTEMLKELRQVKDLPENKKGGIYYQMASDSTKSKMDKANRYGISYDTWYQYITNADTNLDGKVTQKEAKAALDSMNLSLEKKAYIWKLEGWNDKKNPYK